MSVLLQEKTKPILSVDEQIDKLKENGVTFKYVSEDNAKEYLRKNNYYFKLTSYRKNFLKKEVDGKKVYIDLDFAYLQDLAIIDMELRYLLVDLSLDIEHWTKIYLLNLIQLHNEDGYEIVNDFLDSLDKNHNHTIEKEKLFYYLMAVTNEYPVLIIQSPIENTAEKEFLGYEWSGAKGNEGIKYLGNEVEDEDDTISKNQGIHNIKTPMFDPSDFENTKKLNYYIRKNFKKV